MTATQTDLELAMKEAIKFAEQFRGQTSPNPPVGAAAIDHEGKIILKAAHEKAGELHAEAKLIRLLHERDLLNNVDTLLITLGPCNHEGRTPPCTKAIIESGIKKIAYGCRDPNPNVSGHGLEQLIEAGIEIIGPILESECSNLIRAFAKYANQKIPYITMKRAFRFDTKSMIPPLGEKTFTRPSSILLAHKLRKRAGAIITGIGTVLADQPLFTVREVNDFAGKSRILAILDRNHQTPDQYIKRQTDFGFEVWIENDIDKLLNRLGESEILEALVEAGPRVSEAFAAYADECVDIYRKNDFDEIRIKFKEEDQEIVYRNY